MWPARAAALGLFAQLAGTDAPWRGLQWVYSPMAVLEAALLLMACWPWGWTGCGPWAGWHGGCQGACAREGVSSQRTGLFPGVTVSP